MSRASDLPLRRSQPELSSEIVRSVFQCRVSTMNRDNGADRRPTRGVKRAPSSPSSESDPVDVAVFPSTATAFQATSPSSLYTQPAGLYVPSSFREESSSLKDAPTARYLSAKTSDEFEMVANSVTYIGQITKKPQKLIRLKTAQTTQPSQDARNHCAEAARRHPRPRAAAQPSVLRRPTERLETRSRVLPRLPLRRPCDAFGRVY
ncbi:hypothetical protein ON010_g15947 [Phytophthora cinnamomi]|nr:hypothetical protein ON010_g15947 [Phytophthora cinnamomi]